MTGASAAGQPSGGDAPPGGGGMPEVMTPTEAASYLRVAEEDVLAAIEGGELRAKKIGNAYRISKKALDDFLSE